MSCTALQASEDHQTFVETEPENLNFHFAPTFIVILTEATAVKKQRTKSLSVK